MAFQSCLFSINFQKVAWNPLSWLLVWTTIKPTCKRLGAIFIGQRTLLMSLLPAKMGRFSLFIREGVPKKPKKLCPFDKPSSDPRPPRFALFFREKNWPIIFGGKWTIDAWNKFYTWSHPKIFIFASVISVSFAQNRPKSDISGALGPIHCVFFSDPFPYPHNQNPLPSVVVFSLIDQAWPALCAVLPLENPSWTRTPWSLLQAKNLM